MVYKLCINKAVKTYPNKKTKQSHQLLKGLVGKLTLLLCGKLANCPWT